MCQVINSTFVLVHELKQRETCSIRDLVSLKSRIEKKHPTIFVDVSKQSLLGTVSCYPEVFSWEDTKIRKKDPNSRFFNDNFSSCFDNGLDKSLKAQIIKVFDVERK